MSVSVEHDERESESVRCVRVSEHFSVCTTDTQAHRGKQGGVVLFAFVLGQLFVRRGISSFWMGTRTHLLEERANGNGGRVSNLKKPVWNILMVQDF